MMRSHAKMEFVRVLAMGGPRKCVGERGKA